MKSKADIVSESKKEARRRAIEEIKKSFGRMSILTADDYEVDNNVEVISTSLLPLDCAIKAGGFPRGRVTEIYGPEASGKTSIALAVIASAQRSGGSSLFIDAEHALSSSWAKTVGVNMRELLLAQPDYGEQAIEIALKMIESGTMDVVVIDSVAALVPRQEIEGDMTEVYPGLQARLMSKALRKLASAVSKTGTVLIYINQIRNKIGAFYGSPETTTGGLALKYYASLRLEARKSGHIASEDSRTGNQQIKVRVKVVKNKIARPFGECELILDPDIGFDNVMSAFLVAESMGVIKRESVRGSYVIERDDGSVIDLGRSRIKAANEIASDQKLLEFISLRCISLSRG